MPEGKMLGKEVEEPSPYSVINGDRSETFFDAGGTKIKVLLSNGVEEHFRDGRLLSFRKFPDGSSEIYDHNGVLETRTYKNGITGHFNSKGEETYYTDGSGRPTTKPFSVIKEWQGHGWQLTFRSGKIRKTSQ